jgi:4'-phosphopantetheinyl transferase
MLQPPRLTIGADEVHVWRLHAESVPDLTPLHALLSTEEVSRMARYRQERDRLTHLLSRAVMRTVLASYLGCNAADIRFSANAHGKPILLVDGPLPLHFNLTHSRGAIALAVSRGREVGIDIEERHRPVEYLQLAQRFFSADEARHLQTLAPEQRREAFFAIWTLKEAFVKGIGRGLTFPLDAFCFDLDVDRLVRFRPLADFVSADWHFTQFDLGEHHRGALAVQCPAGNVVTIEMRDWATVFV